MRNSHEKGTALHGNMPVSDMTDRPLTQLSNRAHPNAFPTPLIIPCTDWSAAIIEWRESP
jgi:hypothetical protein